jgi:hypothetical protein
MTPSSGESIGLAALRIMQVFQANRSSTFVVANNLGDSVAFNLESDRIRETSDSLRGKEQTGSKSFQPGMSRATRFSPQR